MRLPPFAAVPLRWRVLGGLALGAFVVNAWFGRQLPSVPGIDIDETTVVELDVPELNERLRQLQRDGLTDIVRCRRLALRDMGLVQRVEPPVTNPATGLVERLLDEPLTSAFYAAGRDTMFVLSRRDPTVAHELVHAWEDQVSDRMRIAQEARTTDEQIALRAVIEGTAVVATGGRSVTLPLGGDLDRNTWMMAYGLGPLYVERLAGREPARMVALRPETTYDILFDRKGTDPVELPPAEGVVRCTDRLGPLAILTALAGDRDTEGVVALARRWRGDRLDVVEGPEGPRWHWTVALSDSAAVESWNLKIRTAAPLIWERSTVQTTVVGSAAPTSRFDSLGR